MTLCASFYICVMLMLCAHEERQQCCLLVLRHCFQGPKKYENTLTLQEGALNDYWETQFGGDSTYVCLRPVILIPAWENRLQCSDHAGGLWDISRYVKEEWRHLGSWLCQVLHVPDQILVFLRQEVMASSDCKRVKCMRESPNPGDSHIGKTWGTWMQNEARVENHLLSTLTG